MAAESRVEQLLDAISDSGCTPEEACGACPELLPEVRRRWRQMRAVEAELDALFPTPGPDSDAVTSAPWESGGEWPRIPGYEVEALLGRGGMGVVYRARQLRLNRPVALKMLLAGSYASRVERQRFAREAELVAGLRHPNLVQVYDVGDLEGRAYFTMEFVEGGSLAEGLAGTPRPARSAAELVATLADAIAAAHRGGVVHRDLKPSNVLLTGDGTPKVGDFGLARRLEVGSSLTQTGAPVGTPSYMAPEQAAGKSPAAGPAVDIYALGAILYELLTGRPPFRAEAAEETLLQVIYENPVPPSRLNARVPRDLETICLKCLHKEPHLRYSSAAALAEDLHHFLRGEAITARPERWPGRLARRVRRRPVFSAAVAAGTLVVVGLAGGGLWLISDRAAAARELEVERIATERAAAEDLREMVRWLNRSSWTEARAALERANGRLGDRGSAELRRRLDQGARDLGLAARLDAIPLGLTGSVVRPTLDPPASYEEAFRGAGLGQVGDDPEAVAARVRASNITNALVAALDQWIGFTLDPQCWRWALDVARRADPDMDPNGWRARARTPDVRGNPAALAEVINAAPVADQPPQLLLSLARQLKYDSPERLPFLTRIQQAHPGDFWANLTLGDVLGQRNRQAEAIRYYQAAEAIRPRIDLVYNKLGLALLGTDRTKEAVEQFRRAVAIDPTGVFNHHWLALSLFASGRQDEAIEQLRVAIKINPNESGLRTALGHFLEKTGRYAEALPHHRQAVALDPKNSHARQRLRAILVHLGRGDEARVDWQRSLEADPPEHDAWYGYAELCLFLGQEDEYRRARQALLAKFGATTDPNVAERTARACLLRPATGDELNRAVALSESAAAVEPSKYPGVYPFFLFARGLAEYRQGRLDRVILLMRGEASQILGPAPRLVLAMALHRTGQVAEARQTLATAILSYDWRATEARDHEAWTCHLLRREAEGMILPNLPAFLEGKCQPQDNDERLALLGVCQFTNRSLALARLYTDAFAADPSLAEDFRSGRRYNAARAAALVGCGLGEDAAGVGEVERARWRQQARQWLRADLAAWNRELDRDPVATRDPVRRVAMWRGDPDLSCLFEPSELEKRPPDERKDCLALSDEVGGVIARAGGAGATLMGR